MAGAGVYTYQLVRALARANTPHRLVVFARRGLFDDLPADRLRVVHVDPASRATRLAWEQTVLPLTLARLGIEVLHSPHHHTPLLPGRLAVGGRRLRRIVTIHDLTFLRIPERYPIVRRVYMETVTRAAARVADALITPSQAVRADVIERLDFDRERIVAIPEAPAPDFRPIDDETVGRVRWRYHLPNQYLLSVGSLEPGKNRARLYRAYAALGDEAIDCPLVVAGQPAWHAEPERALLRRLRLTDRVRYLGYVPAEDLPALYSGATAFAFPSLYEGFGLPVLEAMACGAPVVTSNTGGTAEVAGDAALLVDPYDTSEIATALRHLLADADLRDGLRARGFERAKAFSWDRAARETLTVYEVVAAMG